VGYTALDETGRVAGAVRPADPRPYLRLDRGSVPTSGDCTRAACHRCSADYCTHSCHGTVTADKPDPLMVRDRQTWVAAAACIGVHVNTMFPERTSAQRDRPPGGTTMEARALRYCARCPIRRECALDVLAYEMGATDPMTGDRTRKPKPEGVAGASTAEQRRRAHREGGTIEEKASKLEWQFLNQIAPLTLSPSEHPTVCSAE